MAEAILVGLIVLAAALYAAWALAPRGTRLRLAGRVGAWGQHPGRSRWLQRAAAAVESAARRRSGVCSDCSVVQGSPKAPPGRASTED